jgi:hypothetical protein
VGLNGPVIVVLKWLFEMITPLGAYLIGLGFYSLWKESKKKILLLVIWFILPFAYLAGVKGNDPRYYIWPSFAIFIIQGYAFSWLYNFRRYLSYIFCALLVFLGMSTRLDILIERSRVNYQKEFALYLESKIEPGAIIIVEDEGIFLNYYMKTKNEILIQHPYTCDGAKMKKFLDKLERWLDAGKNIYVVGTGLSNDPCHLFQDGIWERFSILSHGKKVNDYWNPQLGIFVEDIFKIIKKVNPISVDFKDSKR